MLWRNERESNNVLDQRRFGGKTIGIGGLVIGAVVYTLMGGNPLDYLAQNVGNVQTSQQQQQQQSKTTPANDDQKKFVAVILADTEDVWNKVFEQNQTRYREPKLVLFTGAVRSACGQASSAVGPFYCPEDERVYLDLGFFKQLSTRLGASGDFAQAYVIAHEVGHHVQKLLGIEEENANRRANASHSEQNKLSVVMELQADCLAGVWARQTEDSKAVIEAGDIDEALQAAAAVGDDRLEKASQGVVVPDSFTHGSSAQRVQAFKIGFQNGHLQDCLNGYRSND